MALDKVVTLRGSGRSPEGSLSRRSQAVAWTWPAVRVHQPTARRFRRVRPASYLAAVRIEADHE
jgi:hypothetical protein